MICYDDEISKEKKLKRNVTFTNFSPESREQVKE